MSEASRAANSGSIYDLGYRHYEGERLGRRYAFTALFVYTLLSIWGIGRSWTAKFFPFGLSFIAFLPALVLLAIAAVIPAEFEVARPEEYFGFVSIVLALICAVAAPELVGRDQRHHALTLYFSRALDRVDYAAAKLGALALSLFLVLAIPQILLQTGNAVAADDLWRYVRGNVDMVPPVLVSSLIVAVFMAAVSLAIAIQTPRRPFATGAVIAAFVILTALGGILVNTVTGEAQRYTLLVSPFEVLDGVVYWVFGATPPSDSNLTTAGLSSGYYLLAAAAYVAVCLAVVYRRITRMSV